MELCKMKKETASRWAFGSRDIRQDLNSLEVAGVGALTLWALDYLASSGALCCPSSCRGVGSVFIDRESAWTGGALWGVYSSQNMANSYTLKSGERFRCACVVGLALLLVFEEPNTGREVVYRVIA